jgi:fatty acid desaturase
VVLVWVIGICGIGLVEYLAFFVYPSISLTLLRSFLEHQARDKASERSVVVEAELPLSLLYLNNNLHAVHHAAPGTAWYRLPALYRARKDEILADNGGYFFTGYAQVVARYLFRPKEPVLHPIAGASAP